MRRCWSATRPGRKPPTPTRNWCSRCSPNSTPNGLRYLSLRLDDGVTFVHVAIDDGQALASLTAFAEFQAGIGERLVGQPTLSPATVVGSYRL